MESFFPSYAAIFIMLLIIFMEQRKKKRAAVIRRILTNKRKGDRKMNILFNGYEGKEVTVYTLNEQVQGRIVEINEGWVKIDSGKEISTVNLDYVMRVREKLVKKK